MGLAFIQRALKETRVAAATIDGGSAAVIRRARQILQNEKYVFILSLIQLIPKTW